jgi:hypothetical protein
MSFYREPAKRFQNWLSQQVEEAPTGMPLDLILQRSGITERLERLLEETAAKARGRTVHLVPALNPLDLAED